MWCFLIVGIPILIFCIWFLRLCFYTPEQRMKKLSEVDKSIAKDMRDIGLHSSAVKYEAEQKMMETALDKSSQESTNNLLGNKKGDFFDFLNNPKIRDTFDSINNSKIGYTENLSRSLAGISLGTPQSVFESNLDWMELDGHVKRDTFNSHLSNENIFVSAGPELIMCGCVFNQVYKIGYIIETADGQTRLLSFTERYGQSNKAGKLHIWHNEKITLEVSIRSSQVHIMLTDRKLLENAYRESL